MPFIVTLHLAQYLEAAQTTAFVLRMAARVIHRVTHIWGMRTQMTLDLLEITFSSVKAISA
jgi:hypothetical protein